MDAPVRQLLPIPHPPLLPFVKNSFIFRNGVINVASRLEEKYGSPFQVILTYNRVIFVSDPKLVREISESPKFDKKLGILLTDVKSAIGDTLFNAKTNSAMWHRFHNVLISGFGREAMGVYLPSMQAAANRMFQRWETYPPGATFDCTPHLAKLVLETVALCGFNYDLNLFSSDRPGKLEKAMRYLIAEELQRAFLPLAYKRLRVWNNFKFDQSFQVVIDLGKKILGDWRAQPKKYAVRPCFLSLMLDNVDPRSGEKLSEENVLSQITSFFLTSNSSRGLIAFALCSILTHKEVLRKVRAELDAVLGTDSSRPFSLEQIDRLVYLRQVLLETLRLYPPTSMYCVAPTEDTLLGNQYPVRKGERIEVNLFSLHRNKSVWGSDAEQFDPDRFAPAKEESLDKHVFKPFGNGVRSCIAKPFSMLSSTVALAMILQRYDVTLKPGFELKIDPAASFLDPTDLPIRLSLRR